MFWKNFKQGQGSFRFRCPRTLRLWDRPLRYSTRSSPCVTQQISRLRYSTGNLLCATRRAIRPYKRISSRLKCTLRFMNPPPAFHHGWLAPCVSSPCASLRMVCTHLLKPRLFKLTGRRKAQGQLVQPSHPSPDIPIRHYLSISLAIFCQAQTNNLIYPHCWLHRPTFNGFVCFGFANIQFRSQIASRKIILGQIVALKTCWS